MTKSFIIESRALSRAATSVRSVVSPNKAIPVLSNVRIEAEGDTVRLLGTNQDCWAEVTVPATVHESFSTTVAADLLADIAKNAPEGSQIEVSVSPEGLIAKADRARFRMMTLPADLFPPMNDHGINPCIRMKLADLQGALAAVDHIKAPEHLHYLQGVNVRHVPGGVECATFDSKRLSRCLASAESDEFAPFTIPADIVGKIKSAMDGASAEICIGHNSRLALITSNSARFLTRLVEGKFTEYWNANLDFVGEPVLFSAKEMMAAITRVGLQQDQYHSGIAVELDADRIGFTLTNKSSGEASDTVCVGYSGEPKRLGLKLQDLRDAVSKCPGDESELRFDKLGNVHVFARSPDAPRHAMAPMNV